MKMLATKFEFEQRFWVIGLIFFVGFSLTSLDHTNVGVELLRLAAPSIDLDGARGSTLLRLVFGAAALMVFLAALLRTWATAYLRTEVVHDASQHSETLVADGPFRYVRNPLYLGALLMVAGVGVMASRLGWLFLVGAMWTFLYRLIIREEEGLSLTHGDSFRAYMNAVPRFWPALRPRVPAGDRRPRWGQAIAGELFFWLLGVAVLCFAITMNLKLTGLVFASSFVVYIVAVHLVKKRAAKSAL